MGTRNSHNGWFLLAAHAFVMLALLMTACRQAAPLSPTFGLGMADPSAAVSFKLDVPRKRVNSKFGVLGTSMDGGSTLTINKLELSLSGPGFLNPLYPYLYPSGEMNIQSDSVESNFLFVPTGWNRFVKVVAKNDSQKIHQIGGVLHVKPGSQNHVNISMSSTPTSQIIEKISLLNPQLLQGDGINESTAFPYQALQYWLDTWVTRPDKTVAANQNKYTGFHPYQVNAQGVVDYLISKNWAVDFKTEPFSTTASYAGSGTSWDGQANPNLLANQKMVLYPGRVAVITGVLPPGSRVWINDPVSSVQPDNPATDSYFFDDVAPSFEPVASGPLTEWTVTVVTPAKVVAANFAVPRVTLDQAQPARIVIDLSTYLAGGYPASDIASIKLSPAGRDWAATNVELNGHVTQQLFAYAANASGTMAPITPDMLDWKVIDPKSTTATDARLQVGNGATSPYELNDYGLVYPIANTVATDAADLITVEAALRTNAAKKGDIKFTIRNIADVSGRTLITAKAERVYLSTDIVTPVPAPAASLVLNGLLPARAKPIKLIEPFEPFTVPAGTTYRWVSTHPLVKFVDPTAGPIVQVYCLGDLSGATAKIYGYSSTGRWAEGSVTTVLENGLVNAAVSGAGVNFAFVNPLSAVAENGGNPAFRVPSPVNLVTYPLNGYIGDYKGNLYMEVEDTTIAGEAYFWRSSDPTYISIEPHGAAVYPTKKAKLTALREGTVTITAMDSYGREVSTPIVFRFDRGPTSSSITLPVNPYEIRMVTAKGTIEANLREQFATTLVEAKEAIGSGAAVIDDPATAKFTWVSNDPLRLQITPPEGESFPNKRAVFKTLRPGQATFSLVSGTTEKVSIPAGAGTDRYFYVDMAYNGTGTTPQAFTGEALLVRTVNGTSNAFGPSGSFSGYGVNSIVTLEVLDPDPALGGVDTNEPFHWTTDHPRKAQMLTTSGKQIQVRLMDAASGADPIVFRVVNSRTNRWGLYKLAVTSAPAGGVNVRIQL